MMAQSNASKEFKRRLMTAVKAVLADNEGMMPQRELADEVTKIIRHRCKSIEDTRLTVLEAIGNLDWITRRRIAGRMFVIAL